MAHCTKCGAQLKGSEKFCEGCGVPLLSQGVVQNEAHRRANRTAIYIVGGVLAFLFLMIPVAKWVGEKKNSVGGSGGGQDMVFYCESTEGATKGMTTVLTLGGDGSVTMIGLHKGIWYRSNQFNEPQKADVTIQGFVDGGSFIDDYHLYRDGQKVVMISHSLGMTCRSR